MTVRWLQRSTIRAAGRASSTCGAKRQMPSPARMSESAPSLATATNGTENSTTAIAKKDRKLAADRPAASGSRSRAAGEAGAPWVSTATGGSGFDEQAGARAVQDQRGAAVGQRLPRAHTAGGTTLYRPAPGRLEGELAWVIGTCYQGRGYGREGALAVAGWLRAHGVDELVACIHPGHAASIGIAQALGLTATDIVSEDGEVCWRSG